MKQQISHNPPLRVLITGGAGFIGSHLAEALLDRGDTVTVIDNLSTGQFDNIAHLVRHPSFRFAIEDITNEIVLDRLASECDVVFHLAAAVGVKLIVEAPVHTIDTNVTGTEVVLRAALRYRAKVMLASTSEVYGKGTRAPFREDDDVVLGPTSRSRWAYAASKMVDEFLGLAYYRQKSLPVVVFRLFNTVGPRQTGRYGMVIPRFVNQALDGQELTVYGDGRQSRCFLHVKDAVEALLALLSCPGAVGQVLNVGSVEEVAVIDLAKTVLRTASLPEDHLTFVSYEDAYAEGFEDMLRRVPDISKLCQFTGWKPRHSLQEIVADVFAHESGRRSETTDERL